MGTIMECFWYNIFGDKYWSVALIESWSKAISLSEIIIWQIIEIYDLTFYNPNLKRKNMRDLYNLILNN